MNAGTVVHVGYGDHHRRADPIRQDVYGDNVDEKLFFEKGLMRTNRALFTKFRYLFRL